MPESQAQSQPQLQMLWPPGLKVAEPAVPAGYRLRHWREGEHDAHARLMSSAGFTDWTVASLHTWLGHLLPEGFFVVEHGASGALVATAMANHRATPVHPFGGELGWVATDPGHRGRGLGQVVCAAVVARLLGAGFRRIYLQTDDGRLPAIKVYLSMGWRPRIWDAATRQRWEAVCTRLVMPFAPIQERD